MKRKACLLLLALILSADLAAAEVRIGVLAFLGAEAAVSEWSHVVERLNQSLPGRRFVLVQLDHEGLRRSVQSGAVDFVVTNPGSYVALEVEFGASRIATLASPQAPSPERAVGSAVIVRADRADLRELADLAGLSVAAVGPEAFGGYQLAWREFAELGIDPEDDFASVRFLGFPMNRVMEAVARGEADAGIIRACVLESLTRAGAFAPATFKVLSPRREPGFPCALSTRLYPDWPLATLRHTPPELAKAVATALLSMPPGPEGVTWTVPADYQSVRELFRELQIGPYAYLKETGLQAAARRYWPAVLALVLLLAGWVIYTVRVEYLVHARTAALSRALEERDAITLRMRAHQERAEHLSRLSILGELSGTLAHEINQPLAAIGNYAQSLVRRVDGGRLTDEAVREAAGEIAGQAERAAGILGRIRAFARKRAAVRERRPLADLVREAVTLFGGMLASAPAVHLHDRLPAGTAVLADPLQIQQVLLNLLKNALDAMQTLPAELRHIDLTLDRAENSLRVAVRDFGGGLDPEARAHLFESFFTTKPDGLGLGLSICAGIVEAHGGRLAAEAPAEGPGMVFYFTLPAHD